MKNRKLAALALALAFACPMGRARACDDADDVFDEIEKTLRSLPGRIEEALGDLRREAPEKARELERQARKSIDELLESLREGRPDRVRVRVGDREMDVPAAVKHGQARLY